ncbi:MAG: DUF1292 domain-containing protein [Firmicutes bacterium]|nr:DUF1292 domain-containing protein [Bacillota bacterium]
MGNEMEYLLVTDENGNEIECEILLTFESEEFGKSYVVYQIKDDESGEYYAASYNPDDDDEGKLVQIETDAEWDLVEEVLESFLEDEEEAEDEEEIVEDEEEGKEE